MRRTIPRIALLLLWVLAASLVHADGMMVMSEAAWRRNRERSMINEPEQKAIVFFSRGREQLIISPSYEGASSDFAWVVPVPARPKVEIVKGAVFHELAKLTTPRPRFAVNRLSKSAAAPSVRVLERKTVGAYDVSVLAATDGRALMKWLAANKYHLPEKAIGPVKAYVKEGWTFVACRIKAPAIAKGLSTGTLAPLKLTFATKKPVYPLRLSSANPKPFIVLVYLMLPSVEIGGEAGQVSIRGVGGSPSAEPSGRQATLPAGQLQYPTLARLSRDQMQVHVRHFYTTPEKCARDLDWTIKAGDSSHQKEVW